MDAEFFPGLPVAQKHIRINERSFYQQRERVFLFRWQLGTEVGNDSVVTGEHTIARASTIRLPSAHIGDCHFACSLGTSEIAHLYHRAAQTEPNGRVRAIEARVIERCAHDVLHRVSRRNTGNEPANEKPRNRRIAIGKMSNVRLVENLPKVFDDPFK